MRFKAIIITAAALMTSSMLCCKGVWAANCPSGQVWNGKSCDVCYDSATGAKKDAGCGSGKWADKPICGARGYENTGNKRTGEQCVVCVNDKEGKEIDSGCNANTPFCNAPEGKFGNSCDVCYDSAAGAKTDTGCGSGKWAGKPICGAHEYKNTGSKRTGEQCVVCVNDKKGKEIDSGCNANAPFCNAPEGKFGNTCDVCYDSAAGAKTDTGCGSGKWAGKPICGARGYENTGKGRFGERCVVCVNNKTGGAVDLGCSGDRPLCNAQEGKFGNECQPLPKVDTSSSCKRVGSSVSIDEIMRHYKNCVNCRQEGQKKFTCNCGPSCKGSSSSSSKSSGGFTTTGSSGKSTSAKLKDGAKDIAKASAKGAATGAGEGAVVGSIVPGAGTVAGAVAGAKSGAVTSAGEAIADKLTGGAVSDTKHRVEKEVKRGLDKVF